MSQPLYADDIVDPDCVVEMIDPDWRDHFWDVHEALMFYIRWSPETVREVLNEQ